MHAQCVYTQRDWRTGRVWRLVLACAQTHPKSQIIAIPKNARTRLRLGYAEAYGRSHPWRKRARLVSHAHTGPHRRSAALPWCVCGSGYPRVKESRRRLEGGLACRTAAARRVRARGARPKQPVACASPPPKGAHNTASVFAEATPRQARRGLLRVPSGILPDGTSLYRALRAR